VRELFEPQRSPQENLRLALVEIDPDVRRGAVARVAGSGDFDRDWAVRGFAAIALMDSDSQARCVAIRGLARGGDPAAVETLLKILNSRDHPPEEVRPPDDNTRWDAVEGLLQLALRGRIATEQNERVVAALLDRLSNDSSRDVRIAAARGLGCFPQEPVVEALIQTLREEDFALVHACEGALVRLTGVTHDCDAYAWRQWLEANREALFSQAGTVPESRRPKYTNGVEKFFYEAGDLMRWLYPGAKDR
jgi:HEAT repeat protein